MKVMLVFSLFQFLFPDPPFSINLVYRLASVLTLAGIFRSFIVHYWWPFWLVIASLFLFTGIINLSFQYSDAERWIMQEINARPVWEAGCS